MTSQVVFELFISQLRGLEDVEGASFSRYAYLLERCAPRHACYTIRPACKAAPGANKRAAPVHAL